MTRLAIITVVAVAALFSAVDVQAGRGRRRTQNRYANHPPYGYMPTRDVIHDRWSLRHARTMSWHGGYYHTATGRPLAAIVPPTAAMQVKWGWGVAQSEMVPIHHQYRRPYPGTGGGSGGGIWGGALRPTPGWPSHTDQFGIYYIRGPW